MEVIVRNSARCKKCDTIIHSRLKADMVWCKCGDIAVEGGNEYLRRLGNPESFEDQSIKYDVLSWKHLLPEQWEEIIDKLEWVVRYDIGGPEIVKMNDISTLMLVNIIEVNSTNDIFSRTAYRILEKRREASEKKV